MLFVIFFLLFVFFAEIFLQNWWIKVMHKEKIEQVTKLYGPAWHEKTKLGTPTMGGVVFAAVALLCVPVVMLWMWQNGAFLFIPREDSIFDWWRFWAALSDSASKVTDARADSGNPAKMLSSTAFITSSDEKDTVFL